MRPPPFLSDALSLPPNCDLLLEESQTRVLLSNKVTTIIDYSRSAALCFQCSNSLMGIPFTIWQLKKFQSFGET